MEPADSRLSAEVKARVEAATVSITRQLDDLEVLVPAGQGVLVPGGFILTATHCIDIDWSGTGREHYLQLIQTRSGAQFCASPVFADPLSDLAALAEANDHVFPHDANKFEAWRESVEPIQISETRLVPRKGQCDPETHRVTSVVPAVPRRVHILTHTGAWISGTVTLDRSWPRTGVASLETTAPIESDTTGSPVVEEDSGRVLGIVSSSAQLPIVHMALPHWILETIRQE
jgi:hypothetical protein